MHIGCEILSASLNRNSTLRLLKMITLLSNCGIKLREFKVTNLKFHNIPLSKHHSLCLSLINFDSPILSHIIFAHWFLPEYWCKLYIFFIPWICLGVFLLNLLKIHNLSPQFLVWFDQIWRIHKKFPNSLWIRPLFISILFKFWLKL